MRIGRVQFICSLLALMTLALYWPVIHFAFINHDDPEYVLNNPVVQNGLTAAGAAWSLKAFYASNWHPMTWLSHMVDW